MKINTKAVILFDENEYFIFMEGNEEICARSKNLKKAKETLKDNFRNYYKMLSESNIKFSKVEKL